MIKLEAIIIAKNDSFTPHFEAMAATAMPIEYAALELQKQAAPRRRLCTVIVEIDNAQRFNNSFPLDVQPGVFDELKVGQKLTITIEPART